MRGIISVNVPETYMPLINQIKEKNENISLLFREFLESRSDLNLDLDKVNFRLNEINNRIEKLRIEKVALEKQKEGLIKMENNKLENKKLLEAQRLEASKLLNEYKKIQNLMLFSNWSQEMQTEYNSSKRFRINGSASYYFSKFPKHLKIVEEYEKLSDDVKNLINKAEYKPDNSNLGSEESSSTKKP